MIELNHNNTFNVLTAENMTEVIEYIVGTLAVETFLHPFLKPFHQ